MKLVTFKNGDIESYGVDAGREFSTWAVISKIGIRI